MGLGSLWVPVTVKARNFPMWLRLHSIPHVCCPSSSPGQLKLEKLARVVKSSERELTNLELKNPKSPFCVSNVLVLPARGSKRAQSSV